MTSKPSTVWVWVPVWLRLAGGCVGCAEGSARAAGIAAADLAGRNRATHSRLTALEPMQSVLSHLLVTVAQSLMTQSRHDFCVAHMCVADPDVFMVAGGSVSAGGDAPLGVPRGEGQEALHASTPPRAIPSRQTICSANLVALNLVALFCSHRLLPSAEASPVSYTHLTLPTKA